ncbi:hypothetical protein PoB_006272900 [Plakobranchus ocellatus]|uniref:Uncharacterized protein n=1 Tax=Plakobranchus ocellatus TaxID=259542 RepID=A0AAV4CWF3_9GAST|nr:hypothetical protein PoB_006272900 [Plakobranchus ocellatus]
MYNLSRPRSYSLKHPESDTSTQLHTHYVQSVILTGYEKHIQVINKLTYTHAYFCYVLAVTSTQLLTNKTEKVPENTTYNTHWLSSRLFQTFLRTQPVCRISGSADYLGIDVTTQRLIVILGAMVSFNVSVC